MKSKTNSAGNVLALLNSFKFPLLTILAIVIFSIYGKVSDRNENRAADVRVDTVEVTSVGDIGNPFYVQKFPGLEEEIKISAHCASNKSPVNTEDIIMRSGRMVISRGSNDLPTMYSQIDDRGFKVVERESATSGFNPLRCAQKHRRCMRGNVEKFTTKSASTSTIKKSDR